MNTRAVLYARVSSKEQEQEGFSIPAQLKLLKEYAARQGMEIVREFVDVEKTDRLYRNFRDYVIIDDLNIETHLVKEGEVLSHDSKSHQKFIHGIKVLMAKNYIDNLSEEVKKGMAEKAAQGDFPHKAPFGYRNNTETHTIEVDEPVAKAIWRLFELYATGQYSLRALRKQAIAEGLTKPSGRPFGISELEYHLKNPIYYGMFRWKGALYRGNHAPLVRKSLFDQVQAVFKEANKPKLTRREFTFRGPLTCGYCGCQLTAEIKKGKYVYYRCTNGRGKCPQLYLREEVVDCLPCERPSISFFLGGIRLISASRFKAEDRLG